jgi:hypothetical protein
MTATWATFLALWRTPRTCNFPTEYIYAIHTAEHGHYYFRKHQQITFRYRRNWIFKYCLNKFHVSNWWSKFVARNSILIIKIVTANEICYSDRTQNRTSKSPERRVTGTEKRLSLDANLFFFLYQRNYPLKIRSSNFPIKCNSRTPPLAKENTPLVNRYITRSILATARCRTPNQELLAGKDQQQFNRPTDRSTDRPTCQI